MEDKEQVREKAWSLSCHVKDFWPYPEEVYIEEQNGQICMLEGFPLAHEDL